MEKRIGNIFGFDGGNYAGNVYDQNYMCPTLNTMQGGCKQPMIIDEPKCLNSKGGRGGVEGLQPSVQDRVYSTGAPSIAITTGFMPSILEEPRLQRIDIPQTVKVRKYSVDTENLCELLRYYKANANLNNNGISNALGVPTTTVEHWFRRDDCFAIPDPEIWMQLKALLQIETDEFDEAIMTFEEKEGVFEKSERHYFEEGLAPTLTSVQQEKVIVAMRGRNPDNPSDRTAGSQTKQRLEPNSQGICNTLTSVQKDNLVLENVYDFYDDKMRDDGVCGTITANGNTSSTHCGTFGVVEESILQMPRGYNKGGEHSICPPITSNSFQENNLLNQQYRIRKLTPLECWRLMDFEDEDFLSTKVGNRKVAKKLLEKYPNHYGKRLMTEAERVSKMSNTQLYKQAGNSIVKNVLVAIFGQMISGKENIYKEL